jgi:CHRD domain-containing protein
MSRRRVALFATLLAAAVLIAVGVTSAFAATKKTVVATMTSAKEKTATGSAPAGGRGTFSGTVNKARTRICYRLTARGIGTPIAAHIHRGGAKTNGPIVVPLKTPKATGVTKGCAKAPKSLLKKIVAHPRRYYVNVHTPAFAGGAIRGQLKLK